MKKKLGAFLAKLGLTYSEDVLDGLADVDTSLRGQLATAQSDKRIILDNIACLERANSEVSSRIANLAAEIVQKDAVNTAGMNVPGGQYYSML